MSLLEETDTYSIYRAEEQTLVLMVEYFVSFCRGWRNDILAMNSWGVLSPILAVLQKDGIVWLNSLYV